MPSKPAIEAQRRLSGRAKEIDMAMDEGLPRYEVFAIRYATREAKRADHFIGGDPHDGPMPMDYFVWLIKGLDRVVVVDSGFTAETAAQRARKFLRDPIDALKLLDTDANDVRDVVLTHLHYDHVGNFHRFPRAEFHLQEPDLHYAVGRHMRFPFLRHSFEVEDVVGIVRLNYGGRVRLYNGVVDLAPGISLHPAPGHSAGLQFVRVHTDRGWIVLASDVSHFYENMDTGRPFPVCVNVADTLESYDRVRAAAPSPAHIIPGHDPLVMRRYPAAGQALEGIAVRLDRAPAE
jgi:glyoxylase-like metal-dependent hydrolase (beta-lactamase superfamily II)